MVVNAPGKVVVLGEYAVVDGAPAIVRAVDRGVRCTVTPSDQLGWTTPTSDDRFVARALRSAPAGHYAFTDWRPVRSVEKVGLGGSAAATVAAIVAARQHAGRAAGVDEVFGEAFGVHHDVQGSGSGIDIAASTYGGWLRFEKGRASGLGEGPPCAVVFSGRSASTGPRVAQYVGLPDAERNDFVKASRHCVDRFLAEPLAAVREGGVLLRAMAERAGIAYWTDEIDELVGIASEYGGAAKPSGAGGGDIVVAVFGDEETQKAYERAARAAGYLPIDVRTSPGAGTSRNLAGQ